MTFTKRCGIIYFSADLSWQINWKCWNNSVELCLSLIIDQNYIYQFNIFLHILLILVYKVGKGYENFIMCFDDLAQHEPRISRKEDRISTWILIDRKPNRSRVYVVKLNVIVRKYARSLAFNGGRATQPDNYYDLLEKWRSVFSRFVWTGWPVGSLRFLSDSTIYGL